jgi:ferredoxin
VFAHHAPGGIGIAPAQRGQQIAVLVNRVARAAPQASRCLDCGVTPVFDGNRCVLCGGCADVCPTQCLTVTPLARLKPCEGLEALVGSLLGGDADWSLHSAILKDEDRCIRCALCAMRCPADAITMERVTCFVRWRMA